MKKLLIVAVVALSAALGACGGSPTDAQGNGNLGNGGNGGNNGGNGYPQACKQFCQVIATKALDCIAGHGHYTQQDLQKVIDDCNRNNQATQPPPTSQQCQTATNNVNAATCSQLCTSLGTHC